MVQEHQRPQCSIRPKERDGKRELLSELLDPSASAKYLRRPDSSKPKASADPH